MKTNYRHMLIMMIAIVVIGLMVAIISAKAEPQTRFYDARGNSIGTAAPQGDRSVRYYDSRGNSLGTSTTAPGGGTTFYDSRGNVTGRSSTPAPLGRVR